MPTSPRVYHRSSVTGRCPRGVGITSQGACELSAGTARREGYGHTLHPAEHPCKAMLTIICENSSGAQQLSHQDKKETVPKRGLGLKIVRGIVDRYTGSMDIEHAGDRYRIRVLIPMDQ